MGASVLGGMRMAEEPRRVSDTERGSRLEAESESCFSGLGGRLRRDPGLLGPAVRDLEQAAR